MKAEEVSSGATWGRLAMGAFSSCSLLCSCGPSSSRAVNVHRSEQAAYDLAAVREQVSHDFRDPQSAQFRNEKIRVLWSKTGSRAVLYCAEVNQNNELGGKTGFVPVFRVLKIRGNTGLPWKAGDQLVYTKGFNADFWGKCIRSDTERRDGHFDAVIFLTGDFETDKVGYNEDVPVLSSLPAPELR